MNEIVISPRLYSEAPPQARNNLAAPTRGTVDDVLERAEEALARAEQALVEAAREVMCNHVEMLSSGQNR